VRSPAPAFRLCVLFVLGLLAGVWIAIAPWVLGYPQPARGGWSASQLSSVVAGALVIAASGTSLVAVVTGSLGCLARRAEATGAAPQAEPPRARP
jgi:hypothetical protein